MPGGLDHEVDSRNVECGADEVENPRVQRRLPPEGDVDDRVAGEIRDLPREARESFHGHKAALGQDVAADDRVRAVRAGLRAALHDLDRKERGQRAVTFLLVHEERAGRLRVPRSAGCDPGKKEEIALRVRRQGKPHQAQVVGRDLGLDVERIDVLLHDREKRVAARCARSVRHSAQPVDRVAGEDLGCDPVRIPVRERIVRPVPDMVGVHPRCEGGIEEGAVGIKIEDMVESFCGGGHLRPGDRRRSRMGGSSAVHSLPGPTARSGTPPTRSPRAGRGRTPTSGPPQTFRPGTDETQARADPCR